MATLYTPRPDTAQIPPGYGDNAVMKKPQTPEEHAASCQREITRWLAQPPPVLARTGNRLLTPAVQAVQAVIPDEAFRAALHAADQLSTRLAMRERFLRQEHISALHELKQQSLIDADRRYRRVLRQSLGLAAGSGVATGLAGAPGLALDVPALVTQALVTIHRVGWCYGIDWGEENRLALTVFALASANTLEEKNSAWSALDADADLMHRSLRDGLEHAAGRELSKQAAVTALQSLARQLGVNLGKRKALGVIPILGAAIGGTVNAWYLYDVARAARFASLARRLAIAPPALAYNPTHPTDTQSAT